MYFLCIGTQYLKIGFLSWNFLCIFCMQPAAHSQTYCSACSEGLVLLTRRQLACNLSWDVDTSKFHFQRSFWHSTASYTNSLVQGLGPQLARSEAWCQTTSRYFERVAEDMWSGETAVSGVLSGTKMWAPSHIPVKFLSSLILEDSTVTELLNRDWALA